MRKKSGKIKSYKSGIILLPRHARCPCLAANRTSKDENPGPVEFLLYSPIAKLPLLLVPHLNYVVKYI
jgi:hypothetical protein